MAKNNNLSFIEAAKSIDVDPFDLVNIVQEYDLPYIAGEEGFLYFSQDVLKIYQEATAEVMGPVQYVPDESIETVIEEPVADEPKIVEPIIVAEKLVEPEVVDLPVDILEEVTTDEVETINEFDNLDSITEIPEDESALAVPLAEFDFVKMILGNDRYNSVVDQYGEDKVRQLVHNVAGLIESNETSKKIFYSDKKDTIFKLKRGVGKYMEQLSGLLHSGLQIPVDLTPDVVPQRYLPSAVGNLLNSVKRSQVAEYEVAQNVNTLARDLGYERRLVRGLIAEGHDMLYLDAIMKGGFKIHSERRFTSTGKHARVSKESQRKNIEGYLTRIGIDQMDNDRCDRERDLLTNQGALCRGRRSKDALTANSQYGKATQKTPFLNEYMTLHMAPNGN